MNRNLRKLATMGLAASMALTAQVSFAETLVGVFQTENRNQDYQASLCGKDDKYLCVKLVALRGKDLTERGAKLIGSYIVNKAKPVGANKWQGKITIEGKTGDSTLTLNPGVGLYVRACTLVVVCGDITLPVAVAAN